MKEPLNCSLIKQLHYIQNSSIYLVLQTARLNQIPFTPHELKSTSPPRTALPQTYTLTASLKKKKLCMWKTYFYSSAQTQPANLNLLDILHQPADSTVSSQAYFPYRQSSKPKRPLISIQTCLCHTLSWGCLCSNQIKQQLLTSPLP